jgi:hypothetical protein
MTARALGQFHAHHQRTALIACQIIANNAFSTGYLTLDRAGQQRIDTPPNGILTEKVYYFIIRASPGICSYCLPRVLAVPLFRGVKMTYHKENNNNGQSGYTPLITLKYY